MIAIDGKTQNFFSEWVLEIWSLKARLGTRFYSHNYRQGLVMTILDVEAAPKQYAEVSQGGAGTTFSNSQKTKLVCC
jgi:hypothetical protein